MPEDIISTLFEHLGVGALGWVVALLMGFAMALVLRWVAGEQAKWLEIERTRSDKVLDALNRNTEKTSQHAIAFDLIMKDLKERLRDLAIKGGGA